MVGNPAVAAMVEHHAMLYADLRDPVALLRGEQRATELGSYWAYAGPERPDGLASEQVAAYSALMAASQPLVAAECSTPTRNSAGTAASSTWAAARGPSSPPPRPERPTCASSSSTCRR
jgi:hypothetical protein